MKIKKLEYYSSSEGGKTWIWERHPNIEDITDKINEIIDKLNEREEAETVRHGKWIEHHEPYTWMGYTYWSCSECGFECGYEKDITIRTNYCPNCGAKMILTIPKEIIDAVLGEDEVEE